MVGGGGGQSQSWAAPQFVTLRQATIQQCDNVIKLLRHTNLRKKIAPRSQNEVSTALLKVMRQVQFFWPFKQFQIVAIRCHVNVPMQLLSWQFSKR